MKNDQANRQGFIATISVIMLSAATLTMLYGVLLSAYAYADLVNRRELRMHARLSARSCIETVRLQIIKDPFFLGDIAVDDFGCRAQVTREGGVYHIRATAVVAGVTAQDSFEEN